jgi:hypothetical protein
VSEVCAQPQRWMRKFASDRFSLFRFPVVRRNSARFGFGALFAFIAVAIVTSGALAQGTPGIPSGGFGGAQPLVASPNAPIYKILKQGEIVIPINLWGFVGGPGHCDVPGSTTLIDLLSYAGGPTPQARLSDVRIIHADTTSEHRVQVYNIDAYRESGDATQNPYLVPGDTVIVSGRALDVFFQTVSVITNIMVIVTALINFISFTAK